jgi:beta-lactam-binding protein with PASTA domain
VTATVTVHNLGEEVERFSIEVNGPAGAFATAEPADLRMLPDKKQTAVLRFVPARSPEQPAGPQAFQVVARSTVNPDVVPRKSGRVVVGGYTQVAAELTPEVTRGRRPGRHSLEVLNGGNEAAVVAVELRDKDKELVFEPSAFEGRLAPGGRLEHPFTVTGPRQWFGRTQTFPFTAEVKPHGVPQPILLQGTRRQVPRFPWWVPTAALAVVALVVAALALWPKAPPDTVPTVVGKDVDVALAAMSKAGYTGVDIRKPDPAVEVGKVIDTDPKAGTALRDGESVAVIVSQGPCPATCPVPVPSVTGLSADKGEEYVRKAGLAPERRSEASEQVADQVIRTEPAASTEVAAGAPVVLFVSLGPASPSASASASPSGGETAASSAAASSSAAGGGGALFSMPAFAAGTAVAVVLEKLQGLGLQVKTKPERTNEVSAGTVVRTEPPQGEKLNAGQAVTIFEATPTKIPLDPASATWTDGTGPLDFPTAPDGAAPIVRTERATAGDETSALLLVTEPATGGYVRGTFAVGEGIIAGDHLRASVMFVDGGVDITVVAGGKTLPAPTYGAAKPGGFGDLDVDLAQAVDAKDIEITVTSSGVAGAERVTWRDLRLEGQTK